MESVSTVTPNPEELGFVDLTPFYGEPACAFLDVEKGCFIVPAEGVGEVVMKRSEILEYPQSELLLAVLPEGFFT